MTARPSVNHSARGRALTYAALGMIAAALLAVAAWLPPSPAGIGTHEVLGLPPCPFHALTGIPCPACGMTTAFAHVARGDVGAALRAQPLGAALALLCAAAVIATPILALARVPPSAIARRASGRTLAVSGLVVWLLSWAYKIAASSPG